MTTQTQIRAGVAVVTFAHPPVNALSLGGGVVDALRAAIETALADDTVSAIVLHGGGRLFSAGADIKDFVEDPGAFPRFWDLLNRIEDAPKPIVAALHGMALGGGLELALACHFRVAQRETRLGLPEVKLGLLPGGGGTQRLPRLVGSGRAIEMMIRGEPIAATEGFASGLVDQLCDADPVDPALAFLAERGIEGPRRTADRTIDALDGGSSIAAARARLDPDAFNQAPALIIDCVEAAGRLDLPDGLRFESAAFARLLASDSSKGLRHAFFAERSAPKLPGLDPDLAPRAITRIAIVGAGLMGGGIAAASLAAGFDISLIDSSQMALDAAQASIRRIFERDVDKGRRQLPEVQEILSRLHVSGSLAAAANHDLVIEAAFEDMAVKKAIFEELDRIADEHAILASNTSGLDLDAIARMTTRPARVIGLHFFSPAHIMRLLEIVRGAETAADVVATALALAKRLGKVGVVARVCDGFIGNRILEEYLRQAYFLAEEGATPQQIDGALERFGMAMGPFRMLDMAGQDVAWRVRQRRAVEQPDRPYSAFLDRLCEQGRYGQKTGRGVYRYDGSRTPKIDPEVDALLIDHSREIGMERRAIDDAEIVERCLYALINEAAGVVEEGIAARPLDVDVVYLTGYGFPAERGGPLFYADRIGLPAIVERIDALAKGRHGWAWQAAPLLRRLAARGETFQSLNLRSAHQ